MSLVFFHAKRSLVLMTLLTQDHLEQIYQALKNLYAYSNKSKLIVYNTVSDFNHGPPTPEINTLPLDQLSC